MKNKKWNMNEKEKARLIAALAQGLVPLRAKAGISQSEIAGVLGVSRQTYGSIERGDRPMTWNTYLSMILFFDYNSKTHQELRTIGAFPQEMFNRFNDGDLRGNLGFDAAVGGLAGMVEKMDDAAKRNLRTVFLLEYARCTQMPSDEILRAFEGINLFPANLQYAEADSPAQAPKKRGRPPKKR